MENEQTREFTQEQYKIEVLKRRIGEITSNYEEAIADQATLIATLRSRLEEAQADQSSEQ